MLIERAIKLLNPISVEIVSDISPRLKKGKIVIVDQLKLNQDCRSGVLFRVIGIYKNPTWLDSQWFTHTKLTLQASNMNR